MNNPFDVQTPENLSTADMSDLFVHEHSDYHQIRKAGHTFITGPRGAGKSMYFRSLEPDCQCEEQKSELKDLDFYAAYIPIKETDLNLPELFRLETAKHAAVILNEHALITQILAKIFVSLKNRAPLPTDDKSVVEFKLFIQNSLAPLLSRNGWNFDPTAFESEDLLKGCIQQCVELFDEISGQLSSYIKGLAFKREAQPYNGPLFGYSDFLYPLIKGLRKLPFLPDAPFFLLIDDADNLNEAQTMILNSWVARRSTGSLCLKISTQEGEYKTFKAVGGQRIDAPHDYSDFNISDKYTTQSDSYKKRVTSIIKRRLEKFEIPVSPEEFFPDNEKQEKAILEIAQKLRDDWSDSGRGFRPNDDAIRYARPDYIKSLSSGGKRSGSKYSYAGFSQIVHLSSGIIRHALETASRMFAEASSRPSSSPVKFIPDGIQNEKLREYSDELLFIEFEKLEQEEGDSDLELDNPAKLKNLINALGGMFHAILISDSSERRVFSIAFSNGPDDEVKTILKLGVKYGYFHKSTIGNKEGTGRVPLYIMTRRLAPSFKLDPTSFAGYKFVTNSKIKEALYKPKTLVSAVKIKGFDEVMSEDVQGGLFDAE